MTQFDGLSGWASSPLNIPQVNTTDYHYQTASFPDQASMDAAFPFGTYSFTAVGGTTDTASYAYSADDYSATNPFLTGTDYSSLQGMNPSLDFTMHLNPFLNGSTAAFSFIFCHGFRRNNEHLLAFNDGFLPASTTSVVIPGGTLAAGHQYDYEIDYSNRDLVASPGATDPAQLGFDVRADGLFTTSAVPEPSTVGLIGLGLLAIPLVRRFQAPRR